MALKHCLICGRSFRPKPQTAKFQRVCGRKFCQAERKRRKLRRWRALHAGHVAVYRRKDKAWARAYPHYWCRYRRTHPAYARRDNRRRAAAMRRSRSAKETPWRRIVDEKMRVIAELRGEDCSAKETPWSRRVAAIEDLLLSTRTAACSAKEAAMALGWAAGG